MPDSDPPPRPSKAGTRPAATNHAVDQVRGAASLAPLPHVGGGGSGPEPSHARAWTPARRAAFLRELGACHSVKQAAASVGMSRQSAYRLRNRLPRHDPFVLAWDHVEGARLRLRAGRLLGGLAGLAGLAPWMGPNG